MVGNISKVVQGSVQPAVTMVDGLKQPIIRKYCGRRPFIIGKPVTTGGET